jgi:hypothetical protein
LPPSPPNHVSQVLNRLEEIGTTAPDVVVTQARAIYAQQGWNVQGNVYQATGNMYVTIQQPAKTKRANSKLETWSKRTALIATVLGIIISVIGLSDTVRQKLFPPATPLRGYVFDDNQQPVADATVEVDQLPGKPQTTASNGSFVFDKVPGNKGDRIRVFVKKSKYKDHNEYVALGDTAVRIKLEQSK